MPQRQPGISPLLHAAGFRHAFYGRSGGVSQGNYASLNCSYSVGDDPTHVRENLSLIAADLGLAAEELATVSQIHGCQVVDADAVEVPADLRHTEADAIVTNRDDRAIAVRTADCVPLLVGCRKTGAAAAIHAGWRGVVAKVAPIAVNRLIDRGSTPEGLLVAIGPHIRVESFEVSPEVASELHAAAPEAAAVRWDLGPRPHVSLAAVLTAQLRALGIPLSQIDDLSACTFTDSQRFFSFRREGKASGRQLSAIRSRRPD